jgi:GNAT superfamily N-acetyltransferase
MGNVTIERFSQAQMDWGLVGPWLCSVDVEKALHGAIRSNDESVWFVAMDSATSVGFALIERRASYWWLEAAWVDSPYRGRGIHGLLTAARIAYAESIDCAPKRMMVYDDRWPNYRDRGWKIVKYRGRFLTLEAP